MIIYYCLTLEKGATHAEFNRYLSGDN